MIKEYENISLLPLNTFGIEARCERLVEFDDTADLRDIFAHITERWDVLGGGSNVLLTGDYHGTLLKAAGKNIAVLSDDGKTVHVRAGAGVTWDDFVGWTVERGLWGAENLSHIPGTVGAAPVQNIGAYGVEAKDVIRSVAMYDVQNGKELTLAAQHCAFGYRDSVFKRELRDRAVITSVDFALSRTPSPRLDYVAVLRRKPGRDNIVYLTRDTAESLGQILALELRYAALAAADRFPDKTGYQIACRHTTPLLNIDLTISDL